MSCSKITNYFTTSLPCFWRGKLWLIIFHLHIYAQFFLHHILRNIIVLKKKFWNNLHSYFLYFLPRCFTQIQNLFLFFSFSFFLSLFSDPLVHFFLIFFFSFSFTFFHIKLDMVKRVRIFWPNPKNTWLESNFFDLKQK